MSIVSAWTSIFALFYINNEQCYIKQIVSNNVNASATASFIIENGKYYISITFNYVPYNGITAIAF